MKVEEINFGVPLDVVGRPPSRHVAQTKKTWEILCEMFPKIFLRCVNVRQGSKKSIKFVNFTIESVLSRSNQSVVTFPVTAAIQTEQISRRDYDEILRRCKFAP